MSRTELQDWLIDLPGFRSRLLTLTKTFVISQFEFTSPPPEPPNDNELQYLLFCASILSTSRYERHQDAALRIAQYSLCAVGEEKRKAIATFILDQLANDPAIKLGSSRGNVPRDFLDRIDGTLLYEHWQRRLELQVKTMAGEELHLNRFQHQVWNGVKEVDWLSISAPTSAGKSFIIKKIIEDEAIRLRHGVAVYVVPTRALVQEVENDFIHHFKLHDGHSITVSSMPLVDTIAPDSFNILVLTQERYHLLLTAQPNLIVNLLVIDESHKIGDKQRGVLLQQVLDRTAQSNENVKVLFASPHIENPGSLLAAAPEAVRTRELSVEQVTVNQNLIWAKQQERRPQDWSLSLVIEGQEHELGSFRLPDRPQPHSKRLPFVALALGRGGGNLIYVDNPGTAEKTATQIYEMLPRDVLTERQRVEISPLIELARSTVHQSYALVKVLRRGVAFHYGNMPYLMRCEIERLFRHGYISHLVCTSTLLEGVNLPCRNIFIRGPRTGRGNPMSPSDFWNLAGRAGRWGTEFQGNIVCLDVQRRDLWPDPPTVKVRSRINPATSSVARQVDDFMEWACNRGPLAPQTPSEYPQILNYLISEMNEGRAISELYWLRSLDDQKRGELQAAIEQISSDLHVPSEIIKRNPGIDPRLMDGMFEIFERYYEENRPEDLLPPDPASEDAVNTFTRVFALIDNKFGPIFGGNSSRQWQLALLVTTWLRGYSLARLISARIVALERRGRTVELPKEIRQVMSDVENYARFTAPKYLSCYVDLLRDFLATKGREDLLEGVSDYGLMLEFGVSETTQLSLISLGLSRTTVVALFELISTSDLTVDDCLQWLREQDIAALDVPILVRKEIVSKFPELEQA